jgi:hypothetical protein
VFGAREGASGASIVSGFAVEITRVRSSPAIIDGSALLGSPSVARDDGKPYHRLVETTFEEAVTRPAILAAWDLAEGPERTISVFDLSKGARQIAWKSVLASSVGQVTADLEARGVRVGGYDGHQPFVWHVARDGISIWGADGRALEAKNGVVTDAIGRTLPVSEIGAFVGYIETDYVDRGIKAERRDGKRVTVLYDLSMAASGNPTYSRNDVLMDTGWIHTVGAALAAWAGVPFRDEI